MENPISRRSALKLPAAVAAALTLGAVVPGRAGGQSPAFMLSDPTTNAAYVDWFADWRRQDEAATAKRAQAEREIKDATWDRLSATRGRHRLDVAG